MRTLFRTDSVPYQSSLVSSCLRAFVVICLDFLLTYITYRLYNLTVMQNALDTTFAALADPTRRAILARLASGDASVMELAEPFDMTQPAISKHLKILERAGLISRGRDAQRRPCRLEAEPLAEANEWLERYREFWEQSFQRLDSLLDELQGKSTSSQKNSEHAVESTKRHSTLKRKKDSKHRGDIQ